VYRWETPELGDGAAKAADALTVEIQPKAFEELAARHASLGLSDVPDPVVQITAITSGLQNRPDDSHLAEPIDQ
jgi:hypothetical protein